MLIVCEGRKTEPAYFAGIRKTFRLSNANVAVLPSEYGTDPMSVVTYAEHEYERNKDYDRVYCVFDRNGHGNFDDAVNRISRSPLSRRGVLLGAISIPCFEVWLLLHFVYYTAPFNATGNRSACDRVIAAVRRHVPGYRKGFAGIYVHLEERLERAIEHGQRLMSENQHSGSDNPSTQVHRLVSYLRDLRKGESES